MVNHGTRTIGWRIESKVLLADSGQRGMLKSAIRIDRHSGQSDGPGNRVADAVGSVVEVCLCGNVDLYVYS